MTGLSGSVVMPSSPTKIEYFHQVDELIIALHRHPVDRRRRIVKGLIRRLVQNSGIHGLNVVVVDQSTRSELETSLEHIFERAIDLARVGLADPILADRVVETVIERVAELAADLPGPSRRKLVEAVRWAGW